MRADRRELSLAVDIVRARLGEVPIWLFGSQLDDTAKGGDIDLYVELPGAVSAVAIARARGDLADALERRVDLVVNDGRCDEPIYAIARAQGERIA